MKNLKRIFSFLITFSLLLSTAPYAFATTELTEVTQYDLNVPYNADYIAKIGDTVDPATWLGGATSRAFIDNNARRALLNGINGGIPVFSNNTVALNSKAEGFDINFNIPSDNLSGGKLDALQIYMAAGAYPGGDPGATLTASGRPSSAIYVLYRAWDYSKNELPVTLKYTDGSSTTAKHIFSWYKDMGIYPTKGTDGTAYAMADIRWRRVESNASNIVLDSGVEDADNKMVVVKIPLEAGKILSEITFGAIATGGVQIFAVSEDALSNTELKNIVDNFDFENATETTFNYAKACANELKTYRGDTSDFSAFFEVEVGSYPLNVPYNADYIAKIGDTVDPATWLGGEISKAFINGNNVRKTALNGINGALGIFSDNTVSYTKAAENFDIKFNVPSENLSGGKSDTLQIYMAAGSYPNGDPGATLSASERPSSAVYVLYRSWDYSKTEIPVTLKYADGSTTTANHVFSWSADMGLYPAKGTDGTAYASIDTGWRRVENNSSNAVVDSGVEDVSNDMVVAKIPLAEGKILSEITFGKVSLGAVQIFAVSEDALSNAELKNIVRNFEMTPDTTNAQLDYVKACAKELNTYRGDSTDYSSVLDANIAVEIKSRPLTVPYNADFIAKVNETVDPSTWLGGVTTCGRIMESYSTKISGLNGATSTAFANNGVVFEKKAEGFDIEFSIPSENLSAKNPDALKIFRSMEYNGVTTPADPGATIKASGNPSSAIYVLYRSLEGATKVPVTLTYADGSKSETTDYSFGESGYMGLYPSTVGEFGDGNIGSVYATVKPDNDKYIVNDENLLKPTNSWNVSNRLGVVKIPIEDGRILSNITFGAVKDGETIIFAVSEGALTNSELADAWTDAFITYLDNGIIVGENDSKIEYGAKAAIELYLDRLCTDIIPETDYEFALEILGEINEARLKSDMGFEAVIDILAENGKVKATASVSNGLSVYKDAVIIIAVYGENDKLLEVNASDNYRIESGDENIPMEAVCDDHKDAVKYKAFIWESLDSMRTIFYNEKDK